MEGKEVPLTMLYRIMLDLAFTKEASCTAVKKTALDHLKNAVTINPSEPNEEKGFIVIQNCYHDEKPPKPCEVIEEHFTP